MAGEDEEVECPTCGRDDFKSPRGMKRHHAMAHGESLIHKTVQCAWCGEDKRITEEHANRHDNHYCDHDCYGKSLSGEMSGDGNHMWDGGLVTIECAWCGTEKEIGRAHSKNRNNHFCDHDCYGAWISANVTGEDAPRWNGGLVEVECAWCGGSKEVIPSRLERNTNHFCNKECHSAWIRGRDSNLVFECEWCGDPVEKTPSTAAPKDIHFCDGACYGPWRSANLSGEDSPLWKGGTVNYGAGWNDAKKEMVRERDGRKCQSCGRTEEEHLELRGRKHDVHHIQKARSFDDPHKRNHPDNLVTLCLTTECHAKWEAMSPLRPQTD